jgi:hypothetical protein
MVKFSAELTFSRMQIIVDSSQKAAATVESLNEETLNKELEALGLPRGTVIKGRSQLLEPANWCEVRTST